MVTSVKFLAALTVLVYNVNVADSSGMAAAELAKLAADMLAPFSKTGLDRLHGEVFGKGRAARSSDVIIINKTPKQFKLKSNTCEWGGFSTNMFPEHLVDSKTSTVFGVESNGFMSGVTCTVTYEEIDKTSRSTGQYFSVMVDNPYFGHNIEKKWLQGDFEITSTLGQGNNNQVRYILS